MRSDYRRWLEQQDYSANTVSTQCSHAARLEQAYGDLDEHYGKDRLETILRSLQYSSEDSRRRLPNPSKIPVNGDIYKSLASFRTAVALYRRFRDELHETGANDIGPLPMAAPLPKAPDEVRERIGLERDLQTALRREIAQLEDGLEVIDEGFERGVASGFVDITARDASGTLVVIELKAGTADRSAIGQILSYMGDLAEEEGAAVRGILVAHKFDSRARAAARMVPGLTLCSYAVRFTFSEAHEA